MQLPRIKDEKCVMPEYCVICQDWQSNHNSFTCPRAKCKECKKKGHIRLYCPDLLNRTIKEEPVIKQEENIEEANNEEFEMPCFGGFSKHEVSILNFLNSQEFNEKLKPSGKKKINQKRRLIVEIEKLPPIIRRKLY